LLLAAFAAAVCETLGTAPLLAVELGAGCGAALLGLALRIPTLRGLGIEREESLHAASLRNAVTLEMEGRIDFRQWDVETPGDIDGIRMGSFDIALANPPYGLPGSGRPSPDALRESARRTGGLGAFLSCASRFLRHHGHFCCIFTPGNLPRLCRELDKAGLGLRRILPVRSRPGTPALRILAHARKGAAADVRLEEGFALHRDGTTPEGGWSREALAFCPWLAAGKEHT
jgi:tRNA1Val (adenine37-N6)-methyltransferase